MRNFIFILLLGISTTVALPAGLRPSRAQILKMNPQLQTLIDSYKADTLKQKAVLFLIDNLPFHGGVATCDGLQPLYKTYEMYSQTNLPPEQVKDSVRRLYGNWSTSSLDFISDVKIDVELLRRNVDFAFQVWRECPWKTSITFDDFCEYVLPYRVGNEELFDWREQTFSKFRGLFARLKKDPRACDIKFAAQQVLDTLTVLPSKFTEQLSTDIYPGARIVDWRVGSCLDLTVMTVYVFRSLGLPCTVETMLMRGDNNVAHYWNAVIDGDGHEWFFSLLYAVHKLEDPATYWNPKGKVWRMTYSLNENMMQEMGQKQELIPAVFQYPLMVDVTSHYAAKKNWGVHIPRNKLLKPCADGELVYLCMSSRLQWVPVGWGKAEGDSVVVKDAEGGVVYTFATYRDNRLETVTDPFLLEREQDTIRWFSPEQKTGDITVFHKFNLFIEPFITRMVGGVFEGSNHADFSEADTLLVIRKKPVRLLNVCLLSNDKSYRYVRYVGPKESYCNISEATFYVSDNPTPLSGNVIGPPDGADGDHSYRNVFDGNPYTSFDYVRADGGWAGLDLEHPCKISKIVFTPRNRDNFIRYGDRYGLFFMQDGYWHSAGQQIAESDSLNYTVPLNALLLLRNYSRGVDERIFEYENGEQIFW